MNYSKYLKIALEEAQLAVKRGDYPIGAILIDENDNIIARHGNESFTRTDVSAHAELLCFKDAGELLSKKSNKQITLYTTLEPCYGCGFFTTYTNIKKIVWALTDKYKGGIEDLKSLPKLSNNFKDIDFVVEPDEECKKVSMKLMYTYHSDKGDLEKAKNYLLKN